MSNVHVLYVGNDAVLQFDRLQNEVDGEYLPAAEVLVTLEDDQGNAVAGAAWPQAMVYVAGSKGVYRTTLPYTLDLIADRRYALLVTVDAGPGLHAEYTLDCVARSRA